MWIAPSLRIGSAVLVACTFWLTPWMKSSVNEMAVLDPLPPGAAWMRLPKDAVPPVVPLATLNTLDFRTEADAALTEWALARFERAGLQLPPLAIAFHDDKQPCDGHPGLFRSSTPAQIDICGFNWNRFLVTPKKTILHELGHAWAHHTLTEDIRKRFLHFRGLDTWADELTPWEEKGSEHAAEIIAWALIDQELLMVTIRNADPQTLAQAYELLTSTEPPSWGRTRSP